METKEKTTTTNTVLEGATTTGASAITKPAVPAPGDLAPVAGAQVITWTRERIDLIKRQVCPAGVTDDEFAIFIEQCKRTQLDPLIKEAFCVPRRVKIERPNPNGGRPIEDWITKHEFQPAEAGMSARADRFPDFRGISAAAVYEGDAIEIDPSAGTVSHKYNPVAKNRGKLVGAWAIAYREGRKPYVVWIDYDERVQLNRDGTPNATWGGKPETMTVKCARAEAWRRSYPNVFGGLYIDGELPDQSEREVNAPPRSPEQEANAGATRTDRVAAKVAAKVAPTAGAPAATAQPAAARAETVDAKPAVPVAKFGAPDVRGKALAELTTDQLISLRTIGEESVKKSPGASWIGQVTANVAEIKTEIARRPAPTPPAGFDTVDVVPDLPADQRTPRQPGEDDVPF